MSVEVGFPFKGGFVLCSPWHQAFVHLYNKKRSSNRSISKIFVLDKV